MERALDTHNVCRCSRYLRHGLDENKARNTNDTQ